MKDDGKMVDLQVSGSCNGLMVVPVPEVGDPGAEYLWKVKMETSVLCMLHF